jgi:hypothetical protein
MAKLCTKCNLRPSSNNHNTQCKECFAEYQRKLWASNPSMRGKAKIRIRKRQLAKFGLDMQQYQTMFNNQNGRCAICNKESNQTLHVDHCHKTGKVRGLLCCSCNLALGVFEKLGCSVIQNYLDNYS